MVSLLEISERVMNLYYQEVQTRTDFWEMQDFRFQIASIYSALLDTLFQAERDAQRKNVGFANVEIPMAWTITEALETKLDEETNEWYAETSQDMFTFKFDNFGYGIVRILQGKPANPDCELGNLRNEFIKITVDEANFLGVLPVTTKVFYFAGGKNRLIFPKKDPIVVKPYYVPVIMGQEDSEVMSDALADECIKEVLNIMFNAKKEVVLDYSNDGNRNTIMPQQTNPALNKVQQS